MELVSIKLASINKNWFRGAKLKGAEPGRSRERESPDHLSVAGVAWRVLVNTLLGLSGNRLSGCYVRPRSLDQTIEAIQ